MQPNPAQASAPSPMDPPKGLSKLFVLLCPSLIPLDSLTQAFSLLAPLLVRLSLILIPGILALCRLLYISSPISSVVTATSAFSLLFLAEQVNHSLLGRKKGSTSLKPFLGSREGTAGFKYFKELPSPPSAAATPAKPGIAPNSASKDAVTAAPGKPATGSTGTQGTTTKAVDAASQARSAVIALESLLYGNELTEDLLPADVLPTRVQRICEEVGVKYGGASMQDLVKTLQEVKKTVGI